MTRSTMGMAAVIGRIAAAVAVSLIVLALIAGRAGGWRWMRVVSPSMEPKVSLGAVVLVRPVSGGDASVGDVIAFKDPTKPRRLVLHRVKNILGEAPYTAVETQGDANPVPDSYPVPVELVVGELVTSASPILLIRVPSVALMAIGLGNLAVDERRRRSSTGASLRPTSAAAA